MKSKFKIGERVIIRKDSEYYGDCDSNPKDVVGVLVDNDDPEAIEAGFLYKVKWDAENCNYYEPHDLKHCRVKNTKIAKAFYRNRILKETKEWLEIE